MVIRKIRVGERRGAAVVETALVMIPVTCLSSASSSMAGS